MPTFSISRRRAFTIVAGLGTLGLAAAHRPPRYHEWTGTALGADARLLLATGDTTRATVAVQDCLAEVERLERIFSLHRADSEISQLNRDGVIAMPSADLVAVLRLARWLNGLTEGLFDPTVQPLWRYLAEPRRRRGVTGDEAMRQLLAGVGLSRVEITPAEIRLPHGGGLTLNGVAQGYITDRVADLLRSKGWRGVLVDLGEVRALEGAGFDIAVQDTRQTLKLEGGAVATSSRDSLRLGPGGAVSHVIDPVSGASPPCWRAVTVEHASATVADGLSTALLLSTPDQAKRILTRVKGARLTTA